MTNASNAFLIDTNVLVYAHDPRDSQKQARALRVLDSLVLGHQAVLSVQCLTEFFSVATRRLPEPLTRENALSEVERLVRSCLVLNVTPAAGLEACRSTIQYGTSLWDSLIWAVAKLNQVPYILTEDAIHGHFREGVRFLNPFDSSFDPDVLQPGG